MERVNPKEIVEELIENFAKQKTFEYDFRLQQLGNLKKLLLENREELIFSLREDFKKSIFEIEQEIDYCESSVNDAMKNLKSWMAPKNVSKNWTNTFDTVQIQMEPFGVVLINSPWNYPILLTLNSFIGAIAAGNCVVIKPSEITPKIASKMKELIEKYLSQDHYRVICGGIDVITKILEQKFDHILYIGSPKVGKIVMKAAAEHLTPMTLELGGKCPCYVDKSCDIELAAKKIAWIKTINVGQICLTIDYVVCHKDVYDNLVERMKVQWKAYYGKDPSTSPDYGRMVNKHHFKRVMDLVNRTKGKVWVDSPVNEDDLYIPLTLILDITKDDSVMEQELFGPILPVFAVNNVEEAIEITNSLYLSYKFDFCSLFRSSSKPLVYYAMATDKMVIHQLKTKTSSGSFIVNDAYMQISMKDFPFGGVGDSGMGRYLGKSTFDTFSNPKSFYHKRFYTHKIEDIPLPPMTKSKYKLIKWYL